MAVQHELLAGGPVNECSAFTPEGVQRHDAQVAMSRRPRQLGGLSVDDLRVGLGEATEFQEERATRVCPRGADLAGRETRVASGSKGAGLEDPVPLPVAVERLQVDLAAGKTRQAEPAGHVRRREVPDQAAVRGGDDELSDLLGISVLVENAARRFEAGVELEPDVVRAGGDRARFRARIPSPRSSRHRSSPR